MSRTTLSIAVVALHTSPFSAPGSGDVGGMNVLVRATAERMASEGHHVEVITRRFTPDLPAVSRRPSGVVLRLVDAGPATLRPKSEQEAFVEAFRTGLDAVGDIDIVHSHHWLAGMAGLPFARDRHVSHVQSFHSIAAHPSTALSEGERPESAGRLAGEEWLAQTSDAIVAVSHAEERTIVERLHADPARVHVVLPGVDSTLFHRAARRLEPRPYVVTAARIEPLKGLDLAIRTIAAMPAAARPDLVIAGGPTDGYESHVDELHALAAELGVTDRVQFAGPLSREDLAALFAHASAALVPSHSETYGLVALEAEASGVPVLAAASGGLREAVSERAAALLTTRDPQEWADRLTMLLGDEALWESLSTAGVRFARQRTWDRTAHETVQVYQRLIASTNERWRDWA
ncbi:glycosyltransferase [Humibacter ginsenosidimutans]|uniref:D-inositol 3-phosphate glycosyltransferase n=1 Tax=Humibacter ginsenosidimutans TaxID=2599293 RepID=A0A5B8M575_9MICO|nr:glycosyltransferase [Humibacter ginsenosidimutans]QDZ15523.1 glycosyltransferase family 1 protein [Humibacter ginsenosidimutans]